MTRALAFVALLTVGFGAAGTPCDADLAGLEGLPQAEVEVLTGSGAHRFRVWIAANDTSRERGLMHVPELPADQGMLFLFDRPQFSVFWMKDTCASLDILFISPRGLIVNIARHTEPFSLWPIESAAPVTAVLEIPAGSALRLGIEPGDRVRYPAVQADH
jgi:uncharacterized membrane protein (UPF0127 family)